MGFIGAFNHKYIKSLMGCTPVSSQPKGEKSSPKPAKKEVAKKAQVLAKGAPGVNSGCFVFERHDDIKKAYTFERELGRGNSSILNVRSLWCCV